MALRSSGIAKALLFLGALLMSMYTIHLYIGLYHDWSSGKEMEKTEEAPKVENEKSEVTTNQKNRDVHLPELPIVEMAKYPCQMKSACKTESEIPFRIVSGAANIIGPSICVNDKWLMSNAFNNVNRGMNVAAVDGKTGAMTKVQVFDVYAQPSTEFLAFLNERSEDDIILVATFDDATQKLSDEVRNKIASDFGSEKIKELKFRDNWIFVGGRKLKKPTGLEQYVKNEEEKNKFGKWPGTLTLEGCIPKFS